MCANEESVIVFHSKEDQEDQRKEGWMWELTQNPKDFKVLLMWHLVFEEKWNLHDQKLPQIFINSKNIYKTMNHSSINALQICLKMLRCVEGETGHF